MKSANGAGIPVHISHLKGESVEATEEILSYIDNVARNEVSFSFDVYPYLPGSTMLNDWLPYEVYEQGPLGVLAAPQTTRSAGTDGRKFASC